MMRTQPDRRAAFTLIELLVVMGIIALLAGIAVPTILKVRTRANVGATKSEIQNLMLALSQYHLAFDDYPPSTLRDVGLPTNKINDGNESLVACLSTTLNDGYMEFPDERLANLDKDKVADFNRSRIKTGQAFEYVDAWGNPFIYFHNRDYDRPEVANRYMLPDQKRKVMASPAKSPKTGEYYGKMSFQLWSVGPNGKNENGGGDDIASWEVK